MGEQLLGVGLTISIAGFIMALSAPLVYAQSTPTGETKSGQSSGEQYKRGETPTGQPYGLLKKVSPIKVTPEKKVTISKGRRGARSLEPSDKSKTP